MYVLLCFSFCRTVISHELPSFDARYYLIYNSNNDNTLSLFLSH